MIILRILLPILFPLLIGSAWADSGSRLDAVMQRGTLRVGSTGDYKPFSHRDPVSGQYQGIDIDMAGLLAKALGVKLEIVGTSWPSLMKDFGENKFDVAMGGVSVNLERQKKAMFSIAYLRDGKTPITRCENKDRFQTLQQIDRPEVKAIVNPGGTNERFARANLKSAQIEVYADNVTIFDQLVAGKADLMITDAVETRLQQKLRPQLCAVHPEAPFDYSEKAYLLPRDWLFKAFVDQWLHQAIQSGAFGKIHDKWIAHPWEKQAGAGKLPMFARATAVQLAWAP
ncbi:MAG: transporter substrate-binding domain-containing protein [Sterolibacterium sp.]|jgi:cyclohexadienyl dehydratase